MRPIYETVEEATSMTNAAEDILFYSGSELEVTGSYFSYTEVP